MSEGTSKRHIIQGAEELLSSKLDKTYGFNQKMFICFFLLLLCRRMSKVATRDNIGKGGSTSTNCLYLR